MNLWVKKNNILCKNITKRLTRARTGKRTEIKQHETGLGDARRKEDNFSQLSKVATCCTTLRPTMDKQV